MQTFLISLRCPCWDMVLPGDALNLSKAAHVERVVSTLLAGVRSPSFTAIKQSSEHAGFINVHLGFHGQHSVVPHPLGQPSLLLPCQFSCLVLCPERGCWKWYIRGT